jgi:hypothetical protein
MSLPTSVRYRWISNDSARTEAQPAPPLLPPPPKRVDLQATSHDPFLSRYSHIGQGGVNCLRLLRGLFGPHLE